MSDQMRRDLEAQSVRVKKNLQDKKDRFFKVLDNDPDISSSIIRTRFGYSGVKFRDLKREWVDK